MDSKETTTDTHAVTKFVEPNVLDKSVSSYTPVHDIPSSEVSSIAEFLARPVLQYNTFWETADAAGDSILPLLGVGLPSDGIFKTNAMYVDKLKGYNLVKADIHYRIQINSNSFQQGMLLAHFLPFDLAAGADYRKMHNYNLTTMSQQPSVLVDCRVGGAELVIPYLAPTTHYELNDGTNPVYERGSLYLTVMSPLKTGVTGTQDVEVTVWVSFSNVELRAPIVPQADATTKRARGKFRGTKMGPVHREKSVMMESKVISKGLSAGGVIASALSAIPSMSTIAAPAAWVLNTLSGVAASFGYSKPDVDIVPAPFAAVYDKYAATSDGANPAIPLAAMSTNSLSRDNFSYGDDDEMSMAFLLSREAYIGQFELTTDIIQDTSIYKIDVYPSNMMVATSTTVGTNTQDVITGPPISYLSNKFLFWRGGIKMRLVFVKTQMQSGRIQVTYTPVASSTTTTPTTSTSSYSIREIIDISADDGEFTFHLPYMAATPYLSVEQSMGTFEVRVINQLRAPAAASPSVNVLVFASACDDFEFAVPCNSVGSVSAIVPQGDESMDFSPVTTLVPASTCIGERIQSIRQVIRFTALSHTARGLLEWWPFGFGFGEQSGDPGSPVDGPDMANDLYSYLGLMYGLYRGSVDVCACSMNTGQVPHHAYLGFRVSDGNQFVQTPLNSDHTGSDMNNMIGTGFNPRVASDNISVIAVPYYNRFPVSLVVPSNVVPTEPSRPPTSVVTRADGGTAQSVFYGRRIREDFQLSLFVGCPPYIVVAVS